MDTGQESKTILTVLKDTHKKLKNLSSQECAAYGIPTISITAAAGDDGIGHYEYCGADGFDSQPYMQADGYQCQSIQAEQGQVLISYTCTAINGKVTDAYILVRLPESKTWYSLTDIWYTLQQETLTEEEVLNELQATDIFNDFAHYISEVEGDSEPSEPDLDYNDEDPDE